MIKDKKLWEKFEDDFIKNDNMSFEEKLEFYDEMYRWAVEMGAIPMENPLEGIEEKIKLAKWLKKLGEKYENEKR